MRINKWPASPAQSTPYQAPLTMSGDSDTSLADRCHPRHTMLNALPAPVSTGAFHFIFFNPPAGGHQAPYSFTGSQILCSFFPSAAVGKEGLEQQVWSEDSIKMQAIESTQPRPIPKTSIAFNCTSSSNCGAAGNFQGGKVEVTQCDLEICPPVAYCILGDTLGRLGRPP